MMNPALLPCVTLPFDVNHEFARKQVTPPAAITTHSAETLIYHPDCLRRKQTDLSHLAQAPNNTLYELLQLVAANQIASAEIAAVNMAILLAFIDAFYHAIPAEDIDADTAPTVPAADALEELQSLLSARSHVDQQLRGNVDAFLRAWQQMALAVRSTSHS